MHKFCRFEGGLRLLQRTSREHDKDSDDNARLTAHAGARRPLIEAAAGEVVGFRDLSRSDLRVNCQLR